LTYDIKRKNEKGTFGEIDEKITRDEYASHWLQSEVFLVHFEN